MLSAKQVIERLGLQPHPEGGFFRETYRHVDPDGERGLGTAIYFLLTADSFSHWHRIDALEIWHWYCGSTITLTISETGEDAVAHQLGSDIMKGERPQVIVPPGAWQSAETLGDWSLVGCTVNPAFSFDGFELAPPEWRPGPRSGS